MLILKNLNLVDGEGNLLENESVLIEGTKIKEIKSGDVNSQRESWI